MPVGRHVQQRTALGRSRQCRRLYAIPGWHGSLCPTECVTIRHGTIQARSSAASGIAERVMVDLKDRYMAAAAEHGRCTESGNYKKGNAALIA